MTFERPDLLWTVPAALTALALFFFLHARRRRRVARAFGGSEPARRLAGRSLDRAPSTRYLLVALAAAAIALAGTGPRDPGPPPSAPARPVEAVLAMDISRSMTAGDVSPSRVARARAVANGILRMFPADRVGVVAFARQAYVLAPPTHDHDMARHFLDALDPELLPEGDRGTRTFEALGAAGDLLARYESSDAHRVVVVVSDGETHAEEGRAFSQAAALRDAGIRVFAVGIGTEEGAPVGRTDRRGNPTGPLLDSSGEPVQSVLRAGFLRRLAREGGGAYLDDATEDVDAPARDLLDRLGREAPERGTTEAAPRSDLPFHLGLLGLLLLATESLGELAVRLGRRNSGVI